MGPGRLLWASEDHPGCECSRVYRAAGDDDAVEALAPPRLEVAVAWGRWLLVGLVGLLGAVVGGGCPARGARWVLLLRCCSLP